MLLSLHIKIYYTFKKKLKRDYIVTCVIDL